MGVLTGVGGVMEKPELLFDDIKDYPSGFRVLATCLNNTKQINKAFGFPAEQPTLDLLRAFKDKLARVKPVAPEEVSSGPVLENIQEGSDIDLFKFPAPWWHEGDGGRYLGTGCMLIMRDPVNNWVNAGTYRLQLHDRNTLGSHISPGHHGRLIRENYWAKGKSCPVVAVFGTPPLIGLPSMLAYPGGPP